MKSFTLLLLISGLILQIIAPFQVVITATQETDPHDLGNSSTCNRLYFFNGIVIYDSLINTTLYLETPSNISLDDGFEQRVYHLVSYNLEYDPDRNVYHFNVKSSQDFIGLFLSVVEVCYRNGSETFLSVIKAISNPKLATNGSIPAWVKETYVKTPEEIIVERVVPEYETWFHTTYGYPVSEASMLGVAVTATQFITMHYINYTASPLPRNISEVVETRHGDCDDMSRVIVELLNYYNIPSLIAYGYVYIPQLGNLTLELENTTYIFSGNGPHAFPMAYIPGLGWLSLDTLAQSLMIHPVIFEGYTRDTTVSPSDVQETIELHRALHAIQVLRIMDEDSYRREFGSITNKEDLVESLRQMLLQYASDSLGASREQTRTQIQEPIRIDHDRIIEILVGLSITLVFTIILVVYLARSVIRTVR